MEDKKSIIIFSIFSTIFTIILGSLLHFTYEWSRENIFVGIFSAINESTWEHLKLLFFPMLITTLIGYFYIGKNNPNFTCGRTIGIITSILFIIIFFYTYTGIIGTNFAIIDIASFFIAVVLGEYVSYKISTSYFSYNPKICIIILVVLLLSFIIFTFKTPRTRLFQDPITGQFGMFTSK